MITQMVDKSNFDNKQYKADLQSAYDCGYVKGMNDVELCQELMTRAEEYQKQKEREFAIAELEKIKAEIEDKILLNQTVAIQIIDKHISELKGENE